MHCSNEAHWSKIKQQSKCLISTAVAESWHNSKSPWTKYESNFLFTLSESIEKSIRRENCVYTFLTWTIKFKLNEFKCKPVRTSRSWNKFFSIAQSRRGKKRSQNTTAVCLTNWKSVRVSEVELSVKKLQSRLKFLIVFSKYWQQVEFSEKTLFGILFVSFERTSQYYLWRTRATHRKCLVYWCNSFYFISEWFWILFVLFSFRANTPFTASITKSVWLQTTNCELYWMNEWMNERTSFTICKRMLLCFIYFNCVLRCVCLCVCTFADVCFYLNFKCKYFVYIFLQCPWWNPAL